MRSCPDTDTNPEKKKGEGKIKFLRGGEGTDWAIGSLSKPRRRRQRERH